MTRDPVIVFYNWLMHNTNLPLENKPWLLAGVMFILGCGLCYGCVIFPLKAKPRCLVIQCWRGFAGLLFLAGAEGGSRTHTWGEPRRILSPLRLPVPPLRHYQYDRLYFIRKNTSKSIWGPCFCVVREGFWNSTIIIRPLLLVKHFCFHYLLYNTK